MAKLIIRWEDDKNEHNGQFEYKMSWFKANEIFRHLGFLIEILLDKDK